ncbi:MAG: tetratricopeptide repeat protein [Polyangiales bacterium]
MTVVGLTGTLLLFVSACGGSAGKGGTTPAKDSSGRSVVTSAGVKVSAKAHALWLKGLKAFDAGEKKGWSASACKQVKGYFEDAVDAQDGRFAEAIYMQGAVESRCGDTGDAVKHYREALQVNPKLCDARAAIGLDHLLASRLGPAQQEFQRALRDDPQCTEAYVNLAVVQARRSGGKSPEAVKNLRRALAIESDYLPAFNQMALFYLREGRRSKSDERLDLAEIVCKQATLLDANYAPIYNTWGLVKMERENIIEALRLFEKAIRLDRKMFEGHMNFGEVTLSFRGYQDAKRSFDAALRLQPKNYEAHIGLGAALRGLKQVAAAEKQYKQAMKLNGKRPEAYYNLGLLYQDYMSGSVSDLKAAKNYYNQFLRRASTKGRYKAAVDDVRRSCAAAKTKRGRKRRLKRTRKCRPGRLQNINTALQALQAAAAMQRGK